MKRNILQANLLNILLGHYPHKPDLVKKLSDLLDLEKEAIYRRLRGEAFFSFYEVTAIAKELSISLDNLIGVDVNKARPFILGHIEFEFPTQKDYELCESRIRLMQEFRKDKSAQITETWNTLPFPLVYKYPWLSRFYYFKWIYQFKNYTPSKKMEEIEFSEKILEMEKADRKNYVGVAHTEYIFSSTLFADLVEDIKYFYQLELLTKTEVLHMQRELTELLSFLKKAAINSTLKQGENKFNLYISNVTIDINQCYIESDTFTICMFRFLIFSAMSSGDGQKNENMKIWLNGLKRLSTLISGENKKECTTYFACQQKYVQTLNDFEN